MSPVPATVPADAVLRTINCRDDCSFFLLLVGVHHSTIRPTDLRLSASKSVAPQKARTVGRAGRGLRENLEPRRLLIGRSGSAERLAEGAVHRSFPDRTCLPTCCSASPARMLSSLRTRSARHLSRMTGSQPKQRLNRLVG